MSQTGAGAAQATPALQVAALLQAAGYTLTAMPPSVPAAGSAAVSDFRDGFDSVTDPNDGYATTG